MRDTRLREFVGWVGAHLSGDEKGEAQIFLERMFQAFGWPGLKEAGATCELRVKKDSGGTAFADLVWKPIVLIEMKKGGADLSRHYRQAFDYWARLAPRRPRYTVLCNFDEFWIYDFETQMDTPVDKVRLADLPNRFGPLAFMFKVRETPVFGNHHEMVTRQAADKLAECFNSLFRRSKDRDIAQRFVLQTLMALFAQDIGLLEKYTVTRLLDGCKTPADTYDSLGGLFEAMNVPEGVKGGRFKDVPYFNGGLFERPVKAELNTQELRLLKEAAAFNWSKVRPEIFGTLFEHCLEEKERSAFGAHFTLPVDIMKIVVPTIVDPWREQIEGANTLIRLRELLVRLQRFTVLDPACGSGNFLYIAYREIKRLEARIHERMADDYKSIDSAQRPFGFVTARNFFGIDINPLAVEIAKVTMLLAHKLAIDELHVTEPALPLDNLDANFMATDALLCSLSACTVWPRVDVIIGNPPFLGAKKLKPQRGAGYAKQVRETYPEVPGMADYCVYWIRRSHEAIPKCTVEDPFAGRAGLVGTQNIRNSQHRVGGLDYVTATGTIIEAVDNQPWSGEANVNVSIVNWVKTKSPALLPKQKRLWFKASPVVGVPAVKAKGGKTAAKRYDLDNYLVHHINSALSGGTDTSAAVELLCNTKPQRVFQGITPGHAAFVLRRSEREAFIKQDPRCAEVIFPYMIGSELLTGSGGPKRFLIDFQPRSLPEASSFRPLFKRVEERVLLTRLEKSKKDLDEKGQPRSHHKGFLNRWWRLSWERSEMVDAIDKLNDRYIVCSRVTKRPVFAFVGKQIRPGDRLQTFMFDDDYSFGILQSNVHWAWFIARCPKQTERFIYTPEDVFNTFPWPQAPGAGQIEAVAEAGRRIRTIRAKLMVGSRQGLRGLYRTLELPGQNPLADAHADLDGAAAAAYGFSPKKDLLAQILPLNHEVHGLTMKGSAVTPPGLPSTYPNPARLITSDCVQP